MIAATYPAMTIYAGDTWPGIPGVTIRINGEVPTGNIADATLIFYRADDGPTAPVLTLDTTAGITLGPADWQLIIPPQVLTLGLGDWYFRLSITDSAANHRTWLVGTLTIL